MNNLKEILEKHKLFLNGDSNGERADLYKANLYHAHLSHADLLVYQTDIWTCYIQSDHIRIGCQYHSVEAWLRMSDEEIATMDSRALQWWKMHKPVIIAIHNTLIERKK